MTEITIDEITSGSIEGTGAFDEIMKAAQVRLSHEYDHDRLKGTDYSKVYLGTMESAMQQSIAYVLGRQQASSQADLTIKQGELIDIEVINSLKQGELIDQQILKMKAEVTVLEKELIIMDSKIDLAEQEVLKSTQEILNLKEQNRLTSAQTENTQYDSQLKNQQKLNLIDSLKKTDPEIEMLDKQVEILEFDKQIKEQNVVESKKKIELTQQQIYSEAAKTQDELYTFDDKGNLTATTYLKGLLLRQREKIKEESNLLKTKQNTENAQIKDSIDGTNVAGIIGKQKELYAAQTSGFSRDAEQKLAKIMSDSFAVRRSTEENAVPPDNLDNASIDAVLEKASAGIGVIL